MLYSKGSDMKTVCSILLVKESFCVSREEFNKDDLLLVDSVSRESFLPYLDSVSEVFISEKLLTGYMEKYGEFSRKEREGSVEIMRVSSPDDKLINSLFQYISANMQYSDIFHEMIILSCISLFSMRRGFVSFVLRVVDSTVQKVKRIIYTDLSRSWRVKDVSALMHVSDSLLKKRLKLERSSFSQILLDMRMQKAHVLIKRGCSVSQTAALCGYASTSYFICQFRKYFKITPFKYIHEQGEDKFCG